MPPHGCGNALTSSFSQRPSVAKAEAKPILRPPSPQHVYAATYDIVPFWHGSFGAMYTTLLPEQYRLQIKYQVTFMGALSVSLVGCSARSTIRIGSYSLQSNRTLQWHCLPAMVFSTVVAVVAAGGTGRSISDSLFEEQMQRGADSQTADATRFLLLASCYQRSRVNMPCGNLEPQTFETTTSRTTHSQSNWPSVAGL